MFDICDQQELGPQAGEESYSQAQKAARTCSRPSVTPGALGFRALRLGLLQCCVLLSKGRTCHEASARLGQRPLAAGQTHSGAKVPVRALPPAGGLKEGVEATIVGRWAPDLGVTSQQQTWPGAWDLRHKPGQRTRPDGLEGP